jgi:hypothetical protein
MRVNTFQIREAYTYTWEQERRRVIELACLCRKKRRRAYAYKIYGMKSDTEEIFSVRMNVRVHNAWIS